jgi:hypothetical protein
LRVAHVAHEHQNAVDQRPDATTTADQQLRDRDFAVAEIETARAESTQE